MNDYPVQIPFFRNGEAPKRRVLAFDLETLPTQDDDSISKRQRAMPRHDDLFRTQSAKPYTQTLQHLHQSLGSFPALSSSLGKRAKVLGG